jgi:hypothetical protein
MKTIVTAFLGLAASSTLLAQEQGVFVRQGTVQFLGGQMIGGSVVKGAPYSGEMVTESTQTLPDGNRIVNKSSSMQYRDSEGRERREVSLPKIGNLKADAPQMVMISDPVAQVNYSLNLRERTAEKMPSIGAKKFALAGPGPGPGEPGNADVFFSTAVPASFGGEPHVMLYSNTQTLAAAGRGVVAAGRGGPGGTPKTEKLETRVIEGVQAEGTRTTMTIPAGQIGNERPIEMVTESWYSPELKMTILTRISDPRAGETVTRLTNINRSEPLRSFFEVPAGYTVQEGGFSTVRIDK